MYNKNKKGVFMKERSIAFLKWFFIILGIIFFIQILLMILAFVGIKSSYYTSFKVQDNSSKIKEIKPIIEYVENYQRENNKYPDKIENVKVKKDLNYSYETTKDKNCYTITIDKKDSIKQYQSCKLNLKNSTSASESFVEYSK